MRGGLGRGFLELPVFWGRGLVEEEGRGKRTNRVGT